MRLQRLWKRSFRAVLLVAVFSLTACSGKKEEKVSSDNTQKEYVYQPSFEEVDLGMKEYIGSSCLDDGRLYVNYSEWIEDKKNKEGGFSKNYFLSCALDGSDVKKTELKEFKKNEYILNMFLDGEGEKRLLTQKKQKYTLYTLGDDGKVTDSVELVLKKKDKSAGNEEDSFYPNYMTFSEGVLYVGTGDMKIYTFDEKGKQGKTYEALSYIENLFSTPDGKVYVYGSGGEAEEYRMGFQELDTQTGKFGAFSSLGDYDLYNVSIMQGEGSRIYLNDRNSVYSYDLSTGKLEEEFNWLNSDVDGDNVSNCFFLGDGKFFVVDSNYDEEAEGYQTEFVTMNKVKSSDVKEKKVLTIAMAYMDYDLKREILSFNKTSEDVHIEVKAYDAYEDPRKQMNLDFTAGHIPDMININYGVSYDTLAKKGIFTDLYPLIEKDSEIKKEDFFPSVLKAMEKDGKLYTLPSQFSPQFLATSKKVAGDREGWTVDEMLKDYEGMKKGTVFMPYCSRESFVSTMMTQSIQDYVNWDTGEVSFDSDGFIQLLEYSKNFVSDEEYDYEKEESMPVLVKKDKLFVSQVSLYNMNDIQMYYKLYKKKGGLAVMSFPSSDKNNSIVISLDGVALAITEQCKDKEEAWKFVRRFLTYDFQKSSSGSNGIFLSRQDAFEKKLEYAMATKKYTDEDGTEVEPYESGWGWGDYEAKIGPLSEEEAEILRDIVSRVGSCADFGKEMEDIYNIVNEELEAFAAGDKSAKETAEVIQSRAKIYVSENS